MQSVFMQTFFVIQNGFHLLSIAIITAASSKSLVTFCDQAMGIFPSSKTDT